MVKEQGSLLHGVELDGKRHFTFSVRLPMVGDTIAALEETQEEKGTTDGAAAGRHYRVGILAQVVTIESIDAEKVTTELLLEGLSDEDFDLIDAQISALKKKLMGSRAPSPDTAASPRPRKIRHHPTANRGNEPFRTGRLHPGTGPVAR